jgi:hypothetical protein
VSEEGQFKDKEQLQSEETEIIPSTFGTKNNNSNRIPPNSSETEVKPLKLVYR